MSRHSQNGTTTVEFALAGAIVLIALLGSLQVSLLLYAWNTLGEGTRRAARLAVVCPPDHPSVYQAALLNTPGDSGAGRFVPGLTTANVSVQYLDAGGAATTSPAQMRYARVGIIGYSFPLSIPFLSLDITAPSFATTLSIESRGYQPDSDSFACPGA